MKVDCALDRDLRTLTAEIALKWADRRPVLADIDALADALVQYGDRHGWWIDRGQARTDALTMIVCALTDDRSDALAPRTR